MQEYDKIHPLDLSNKEEEKEEIKEKNISNKLTKEEEMNIQGYENLLKRILKVFNILYLCKTKQEFINLMKEKGINQNDLIININDNKNSRTSKKTRTRRNTRRSVKINSRILNKKTTDEEEDSSNYDHDKNIMNRFIIEQKKEIDDFIKIKKVELKSNQNNNK